jgi:hypothetical protein
VGISLIMALAAPSFGASSVVLLALRTDVAVVGEEAYSGKRWSKVEEEGKR